MVVTSTQVTFYRNGKQLGEAQVLRAPGFDDASGAGRVRRYELFDCYAGTGYSGGLRLQNCRAALHSTS